MDKTSFDLDATSAAIILKQDTSMELILPKMKEDDVVDLENNQNIFIAMAIVSLADDPKFRKFVGTRLQTMLNTAESLVSADEEAPMCSPNSCPGSCCGPKNGNTELDEIKDLGDGC